MILHGWMHRCWNIKVRYIMILKYCFILVKHYSLSLKLFVLDSIREVLGKNVTLYQKFLLKQEVRPDKFEKRVIVSKELQPVTNSTSHSLYNSTCHSPYIAGTSIQHYFMCQIFLPTIYFIRFIYWCLNWHWLTKKEKLRSVWFYTWSNTCSTI